MTADARAPLQGIAVLEVGGLLAAPFATMQLADLESGSAYQGPGSE